MARADAVLRWSLAVLRAATAFFLFAIMALTFCDVIERYVFAAPIYRSTEMIQGLPAITIFGGLALLSDHDAQIAVDLLDGPFTRARGVATGLISTCGFWP